MKRSSMLVAVAEVVRDDVERDLVHAILEAVAIERLEAIVERRIDAHDVRRRAPTRSARPRCRRSPCRGCSTRRRGATAAGRLANQPPAHERSNVTSCHAAVADRAPANGERLGERRVDHRLELDRFARRRSSWARRERRRACGDGDSRRRRARPRSVGERSRRRGAVTKVSGVFMDRLTSRSSGRSRRRSRRGRCRAPDRTRAATGRTTTACEADVADQADAEVLDDGLVGDLHGDLHRHDRVRQPVVRGLEQRADAAR